MLQMRTLRPREARSPAQRSTEPQSQDHMPSPWLCFHWLFRYYSGPSGSSAAIHFTLCKISLREEYNLYILDLGPGKPLSSVSLTRPSIVHHVAVKLFLRIYNSHGGERSYRISQLKYYFMFKSSHISLICNYAYSYEIITLCKNNFCFYLSKIFHQ